MCKTIVTGMKWNGLECIESGEFISELPDNASENERHEYKMNPSLYFLIYGHKIKCACGKVFDIVWAECPGKRKIEDCGCGSGSGRTIKISISLYLQVATLRRLAGMGVDDLDRIMEAGLNELGENEKAVRDRIDAMTSGGNRGLAVKRISEAVADEISAFSKHHRLSRSKAFDMLFTCGLEKLNRMKSNA